MTKLLYTMLGFVSLFLGAVGTVLPILPTVPFFLLSAFCFGKSSATLNQWFRGTKLYQTHLDAYVKGEGMTTDSKVKTLSLITLLLGVGFYHMNAVPVARGTLCVVWMGHMLYFLKKVPTKE